MKKGTRSHASDVLHKLRDNPKTFCDVEAFYTKHQTSF